MFIILHYALVPFLVQVDLIKAIFPAEVGSVIYFVGDEDGYNVDETADEIMEKLEGVQ